MPEDAPIKAKEAPADLAKEREVFLKHFLRRGIELTESLIDENRLLRLRVEETQEQIRALQEKFASDDAMGDLMRKIEVLEQERRDMRSRRVELEASHRKAAHRSVEVERELHDLANLFIASSHLHATLTVGGVLQHLRELLQQLVGVEAFVLYVAAPDDKTANPLTSLGVDGPVPPPVDKGRGRIGDAFLTGIQHIKPRVAAKGTLEDPVAVVPLTLDGAVVGVLAILSVLTHKSFWAPVDHELFKLLGARAATALVSAHLLSAVSSPSVALRELSAVHWGGGGSRD